MIYILIMGFRAIGKTQSKLEECASNGMGPDRVDAPRQTGL